MSRYFRQKLLATASFAALIVGCSTVPELEETASGITTPQGAILWEAWTDIPGKTVADFRNSDKFGQAADDALFLAHFEAPRRLYDQFGARIRGFLVPTESGLYQFYMSGNDAAELWLSSDSSVGNAKLIAEVPGPTKVKEWSKYPQQISAAIELVAGNRYYIEAIQKDNTGGDHLTVAWSQQTSTGSSEILRIAGSYLAPYMPYPEVPLTEGSYDEGYRVGYTDGQYGFAFTSTYPALDSDGDGLPDNWEKSVGLDPQNALDAIEDADGDGLSALEEWKHYTAPLNVDTDGDGIPDDWEIAKGLAPLLAADALYTDSSGQTYLAQYQAEFPPSEPEGPPAAGAGEIVVQWSAPTQLQDGTPITEQEITAYTIHYGVSADQLSNQVTVDNDGLNYYVISSLEAGTYHVAISATAVLDETAYTSPLSGTKQFIVK